jgi:hypothetical protein
LIEDATATIQQQCGRTFLIKEYEDFIFDGGEVDEMPRKYVCFPYLPITEWTTLEYKRGTETAPDWTEVDRNNYTVDFKRGIIYSRSGFLRGFQNLRATFTAGYLVDWDKEENPAHHTLPKAITALATQYVAKMFQLRASQGLSSETTEGQSVSYMSGGMTEFTKEQQAIIDEYKINPFGII